MNWVLLAITLYVLAQFAVGVYVSRKMASDTDYILAGRQLGLGLVVFSVFATFFGAEAIIASAGNIHENGLRGGLVDPFGYAAALVIVGVYFAARLRNKNLVTFADFFKTRYSDRVEKLVVLVLLPGSLFWGAAQIRSFGQVIGAQSGISLTAAITIAALLVMAYSIVGGLMADAVTDFLQGIVLIIGLLVLFFVISTLKQDGFQGLAGVSAERLTFFGSDDGPIKKIEKLSIAICGTIVAVELISRFLGAQTGAIAARGTIIGGILYLIIGLIPLYIGLVGPQLAPNLKEAEQIVPTIAETFLPTAAFVIFIGALISAILSVVHATLHAPAAQVAQNLLGSVVPNSAPKKRLWLVRLTVAALSVVAFALALTSDTIKELVETASAFGSAGVFIVTMFGLFTRFGGERAAFATILTGVLVWAAARYVFTVETPYLIGLFCSLATYVAVARLSEPKLSTR
ncbi:MAG: hypothetical protein RL291_1178 [Pseudomonadota bacterium]